MFSRIVDPAPDLTQIQAIEAEVFTYLDAGRRLMTRETIGDRLDRFGGVGPGFDLTRLALAVLVVFIHTSLVGGIADSDPAFPGAPFGRWAIDIAAVPMFFALSGFLIAASAERLSVGQFLTNRFLRILPALAVAIFLAALLLGPLLTTLPLGSYFADPKFASYFLNIVGLTRPELPGLFATDPVGPIVNGSLWTVPHEVSCYLGVALLMAFGLHRRRGALLAITIGLFAVAAAIYLFERLGSPLPFDRALSYVFVTRGAARLIPIFMLGMLFYHYRRAIPCRRDFAFAAVALYFAISSFGTPEWAQNPLYNLATAPLYAYVVIAAGLSPSLEVSALKGNDYSYGIYLYAFPLQQSLVAAFPDLKNGAVFFLLSLAVVAPVAVLSWRFVEKPILKLRRRGSRQAPAKTLAVPATAQAPAPTGSRAVA